MYYTLEKLKDFKMDEWNPISITANPLSSYSLDVAVAHKFSKRTNGWMISSLVSKDDIWSNFWAHSYAGNEREFLLINKERESVGIRADAWTEAGKHISPLASDYNSYGFIGGSERPYAMSISQKKIADHLSSRITGDFNNLSTYKDSFTKLSTQLDEWMEDEGMPMPASMALEVWNSAAKDAAWKKDTRLQDNPAFLSFIKYVGDKTKQFETKAG